MNGLEAGVRLLLFDIDGTLVRTAGAGKHSMDTAFQDVYGVSNGFEDIPMMGRTDPAILREALENHGIVPDGADTERFRTLYFQTLESEIRRPREGKRACTGIPDLMEALHARSDVLLGLLTGNWRRSAMMKLHYFNLDTYFRLGAFADDSENRNNLVPVAVDRAGPLLQNELTPEDVFVIGDTPLDVACARPHGARTVAVATGFHSRKELETSGADFVFSDLGDTKAVVEAMTR